MIKLEKILVATDFSEHSQVAFQYGVELAKAFEASLTLLHVVEPPEFLAQVPPGGEGYFPPNLPELQGEEARKRCDELIAASGLPGAEIVIVQGSAFVEIIRAAREDNIDLIVLGTHGRGAIAHLLLGSVAERVVRKAPCPVLTVRHGEHEFVMP